LSRRKIHVEVDTVFLTGHILEKKSWCWGENALEGCLSKRESKIS